MPYFSHAVWASLLGLALAASPSGASAQEAAEVRKNVAAAAAERRIPLSQVIYLGPDGKPISEHAFYQALPSNKGYTLASSAIHTTGNKSFMTRLAEKFDPKPATINQVVVSLHGKPAAAPAAPAAPASPECCSPEAARRSINALAQQYGISRERMSFLGADGAAISEQAFYAALAPAGHSNYHVTTSNSRSDVGPRNQTTLLARVISPKALAVGSDLPVGKPQCCRADEARAQIAAMAQAFKVAPESIAYKGVHGKPVPGAAFYDALSTMPGMGWEFVGSTGYSSKQGAANSGVVVRLRQKKVV